MAGYSLGRPHICIYFKGHTLASKINVINSHKTCLIFPPKKLKFLYLLKIRFSGPSRGPLERLSTRCLAPVPRALCPQSVPRWLRAELRSHPSPGRWRCPGCTRRFRLFSAAGASVRLPLYGEVLPPSCPWDAVSAPTPWSVYPRGVTTLTCFPRRQERPQG